METIHSDSSFDANTHRKGAIMFSIQLTDILSILLFSVSSVVVLFILTKLMGYRQMSQLSMFDYINGITIGSIAAEMATASKDDFWEPLLAMIIYSCAAILLSVLSNKSLTARRFISGSPLLLLHNGEIYEKNMRRAKIDLSELTEQARISGYFDLSELSIILLETNGRLSFLPKAANRPATPSDLSLTPPEDSLCAVLVMDGKLLPRHLSHCGKDEKWLKKQLSAFGVKAYREVLLATCDADNHLNVYLKKTEKNERLHIL